MDQMLAAQDRTFDLAIEGMSCASCVARVEKALRRVPGVREAAVNLATESAHVEIFAPVPLEGLVQAVERAGYHAALRRTAQPPASRREFWELIAAILLALPLFGSMLFPVPAAMQFALALPIQFWLGARFYIAGYKALRAGSGNMDLLVALGTSAAFGLSAYNFFAAGPLYFESSAAIIALVRLGKFLEQKTKREAAKAVAALATLRPAVAHLADGADVPVAQLRPGARILVRPGERVPADGVILEGRGSVDESAVTGESLPVAREAGSRLLAGSLVLDAVLRLEVQAGGAESFIARMARLIEAAQASKPAVQKLADLVAAWFVPVVVVFGLFTFAGWVFAGATLDVAIINAVSVLVIACPCALGLAIPAAILAGTGAAARHGILVRDADVLQAGAKIGVVMFDKTGTLTTGTPHLAQSWFSGAKAEAERIAASLAAADTHPLAQALRREGVGAAASLRAHPGRGVEGIVDGRQYLLGSAVFLREAGIAPPAEMADSLSWSYLGAVAAQKCLAGFGFADTIRPCAEAAVAWLRQAGIRTIMLSGDRGAAAESVAAALGLDEVRAELSPEQKLQAVRAARAQGQKLAMVGDGINDAAALAAADVGIAIGSGSDVALEAADILILRPDPMLVPAALDLARRSWNVMRQGLVWAMIYNLVGIPAAAFGLLSPTIAGGAMAASSVCVLGNAMRLKGWRPR